MQLQPSNETRVFWLLLGISVALWFAPVAVSDAVRGMARDVLVPGQRVLLAMNSPSTSALSSRSTEANDSALLSELRRKELEIAELRQRVQQLEAVDSGVFQKTESAPLISLETLSARIISSNAFPHLPEEITIDRGRQGSVKTDLLVVVADEESPDLAVADIGRDAALKPGDRVISGRSVVGRVQRTGLLSSVLQSVTHSEYSAVAQVGRRTTDGLAFDAEGILAGTGSGHCLLEGIPDTATVSVGDEVFTTFVPGRPRLYFGKIVQAELRPGSTWHIVVRPQIEFSKLTHVDVLRAHVNEKRVVGL